MRSATPGRMRSGRGNEGDLMLLGGWRSRAMLDRYERRPRLISFFRVEPVRRHPDRQAGLREAVASGCDRCPRLDLRPCRGDADCPPGHAVRGRDAGAGAWRVGRPGAPRQLLQRGHAGPYTGDGLRGDPARLPHRPGRRCRRVLKLGRCPDNFGETLAVDLQRRRSAQRSVERRQLFPRSGGDERGPAGGPSEQGSCAGSASGNLKHGAPGPPDDTPGVGRVIIGG